MTLTSLLQTVTAGAASAALLIPLVGGIGHLFAALPWVWAKTVGNILNAVSLDVGDFVNALNNARAAVATKKDGANS